MSVAGSNEDSGKLSTKLLLNVTIFTFRVLAVHSPLLQPEFEPYKILLVRLA